MRSSPVILRKTKKNAKIGDFVKFGHKYLGADIFTRHQVCGSKLENSLVSHMIELNIFHDGVKHESQMY